MAVFSHDTRTDKRGQLGGGAACGIVPGALQDRGAFPGDGVFPYLANFYWCAIWRTVRVWVRHATESRIADVWSANLTLRIMEGLPVRTKPPGGGRYA